MQKCWGLFLLPFNPFLGHVVLVTVLFAFVFRDLRTKFQNNEVGNPLSLLTCLVLFFNCLKSTTEIFSLPSLPPQLGVLQV